MGGYTGCARLQLTRWSAPGLPWAQPLPPPPRLAGHFELDLSLPLHRFVAARLKDAAAAEPEGPSWLNLAHDNYSGWAGAGWAADLSLFSTQGVAVCFQRVGGLNS